MRTWLTNHPVLFALSVAAATFAATLATINYVLGSWLILPLI
jgi:hypothetical protein